MELVKKGDKVIYNIRIYNGYPDNIEYNFKDVTNSDGEIISKNSVNVNFTVKMGINFNFNIFVIEQIINFKILYCDNKCFIELDKIRPNIIIEGDKTDNIKITINPY